MVAGMRLMEATCEVGREAAAMQGV